MFTQNVSATLPESSRLERSAVLADATSLSVPDLRAQAQAAGAYLLQGFAIDLRSLAVFRIGLGIMALANALVALSNAEIFYSDTGAYPRVLLLGRQWENEGLWSLHMISGSVFFQIALLLVQSAAALCLVAGFRTRLAVFVSWILAVSLETRSPGLSNGSDAVMRMLLFWSFFLPLAARWSVDNIKAGFRPIQSRLLNFATAALLLQITFVYVFSAVLKDPQIWFVEAKGLLLTLHLDAFTTPFGLWLRSHEELCKWLCRGAIVLELVGPVLAVLPVMRPQLKIAMAMSFVAFHLGIALSMDIGAFPWLMIAAWSLMLPAEFWNWLGRLRTVQHVSALVREKLPLIKTQPEPQPAHLAGTLSLSTGSRIFVIVSLMFVFMWNLRGVNFERWEKIFPKSLNGLAFMFRLDQHWCMFAPCPSLEDGWMVLTGDLSDGTQVDIMSKDGSLSWDKPALSSATYKDSRWQKYLMNLWQAKYTQHRPWFGNYLAEKWNETHGALSQVGAWELFYMKEPVDIDGKLGAVEKISLWKCQSFAGK